MQNAVQQTQMVHCTWTEGTAVLQVDDLLAFSKHIRLRYRAGLPAFVGGQSMGALTALHAVLRDQSTWDGIVLGTATIDVEWTWFLR